MSLAESLFPFPDNVYEGQMDTETSDVSSAPIAKVIGGYLSAVLHSMYRRLASLDYIESTFKN